MELFGLSRKEKEIWASIIPWGDFKCIFARNCEGAEQLRCFWEIAQRSITKGNEEKSKKFPTMKSLDDVNKKNDVNSTASEVHTGWRRMQKSCDFVSELKKREAFHEEKWK